jgi:O-antigen/teichoic acid export membrane protein
MAGAVLDARRSLARVSVPHSLSPAAVAELEASVDPVVPPPVEQSGDGSSHGRRHLVTDVATALVALALLAALQSLDVVILGREAPANSGPYAAISVSSKVLVFGAVVLSAYLLPEAAIRWQRGDHALRQLGAALALLALPGAGLLAVAVVAPERFLEVFFGPRLAGAAPAFAELVVAMACLSATVLFTHYLLGAGRREVVGVLAVATLAAGWALLAADGAPVDTARADLGVQAAVAVVAGAMVVRVRRRPAFAR